MFLEGWLDRASEEDMRAELLRLKLQIIRCNTRIEMATDEIKQIKEHLNRKSVRRKDG